MRVQSREEIERSTLGLKIPAFARVIIEWVGRGIGDEEEDGIKGEEGGDTVGEDKGVGDCSDVDGMSGTSHGTAGVGEDE